MTHTTTPPAGFDAYAAQYDATLNQGLALVGEDKEYFARERMHWLGRRLAQLEFDPNIVLDFGCGTGSATPHFYEALGVNRVIGIDVSAESLAAAERSHGSFRTSFQLAAEYEPKGEVDLAFCNGVFHHIAPANRPACVAQMYHALRPGGLFAFWENNPWNLGTRWVMSRIPFDRDAVLVWPGQARQLLFYAGFSILFTDFAFIFPAFLHRLRPIERHLRWAGLGGQYLVLAIKPKEPGRVGR